jgi:hypothetical protein
MYDDVECDQVNDSDMQRSRKKFFECYTLLQHAQLKVKANQKSRR